LIPTGGQIGNESINEAAEPSRTWRLDFEKGRATGMIDGLEAVRQAAHKTLMTERFAHLIYDSDYGAELNKLIGLSQGLMQSETRRRIREALLQDERIDDVANMEIEASGDGAAVRFLVLSSLGESQEEVKIHV